MKLVVIEDDAAIRETLVDFFSERGHRVHAYESTECAEPHGAEPPDAILLDLQLPGEDGLAWLARRRADGDATPVVILTARGEEEQRIAGLRAGGDDYLVKPFSVRELEARVEAVLRRANGTAGPAAVRIGAATIDLAGHEIRRDGQRYRLQQKEAELLDYFLRHRGETLDRMRLLREVWGYESLPTTRTVDTHVLNLRKKIESTPERPEHLITIHRVGYRLV